MFQRVAGAGSTVTNASVGRSPGRTETSRTEKRPTILPAGVDVDVLARRVGRQPGHHRHVAAIGGHEPGAGEEARVADGHAEAFWPALERRVVAERQLGLGHAHRQMCRNQGARTRPAACSPHR